MRLDFTGSATIDERDRLALLLELSVVLKKYAVDNDSYSLSILEGAADPDGVRT